MLSIKDYVYSIKNGLGIILEAKGNQYRIRYDGFEETEDASMVSEIAPEIIEQLKNESFRDYYGVSTIKKGEAYNDENRVESFYISGHNISGTVKGNENYSVTMSFNKGAFRSRCSCPVGAFCKHSVAVLFAVSDKMKKLERTTRDPHTGVPSQRASYAVTPDVELWIRKLDDTLNRSSTIDLDAFIALSNRIKASGKPMIEALLSYMDENMRSKKYYFNAFKRIFYMNDSVYQSFLECSDAVKNGFFGKEIQKRRKSENESIRVLRMLRVNSDSDIEMTLCYYILNDRLKDAMDAVLKRKNRTEFESYLPVLLDYTSMNSQSLADYISFVNQKRDIPQATAKIMKQMSELEKKDFLQKCPGVKIPLDELRSFPFNQQLDMLLGKELSEEEKQYVLNKYYTLRQFDEKKAIQLLFTLGYHYPRYQRNCATMLKETKDAIGLLYFYNGKELELDQIDGIFKYTDLGFKIADSMTDYQVNYFLSISNLVLSICHKDSKGYYRNFARNELNSLELAYVSKIEESPKFQEEFKRVSDIVNKRNEERIRQSLSFAITSFAQELSLSNNILLNESHKMHVEPTLYSTYGYNGGKNCISLRVGNEKLYIVKDVVEFLDAVRDSVTIRYGKGLEFCHRIDNFDEPSQKLINYFLSLPYRSFERDQRKGIALSDLSLNAFLEAMKGEYIYYCEDKTILRLDEIEPVISIDRNYTLSTSFDGNKLFDIDNLYLYNPKEHCIDKIKGSRDEIRFYRFAYNNQGMNVSLVRQQFIDNIYCRFFNHIEIADEIKQDFQLSDLEINAYFDFDSRAIHVNTVLCKESVEIKPAMVTSASDLARLSYYEDYLKSLGFEDNKIIDEGSIYSFFTMDFTPLREICNVFLSDSISNKTVSKMEQPTVRIQYNNNMMEMFMEESPYTEEELYQILSAIRKKKKYVLLKNDRIVDVNNQESKEFLETIDDLGMDDKHLYTVKEAPIYQSLKAYAHLENVSVDDYVKKMMSDITSFKESDLEIPNVDATLREYQKDGYRWMSILSDYKMGGILADDMGLGKTLEIITLLKGDLEHKPSLIVCPKSLIFNWIAEFERFDKETRVVKLYGTAQERKEMIEGIQDSERVIYVTGYDSLRNDIDYYQGRVFNYIVLDEAQSIKNVHAGKSKSVKSLSAVHKFALTGTPIENNVIDLWSIFDFLMPGYFPELSEFKSRYEASDAYTKAIAKKVAPFILRRTKTEVLKDLPPKYERILSVDMTSSQRRVYDAYILEARNALQMGGKAFDMLPYLMRLRQICVDPKTFIDNYADESGKMKELQSILPEYIENGHRILLFSTFVSGLHLVEDYLKKQNIPYLILTGDTKLSDRQAFVNQFNSDTSIKVFLISLKAGGTGLNLVGADTVIHLDPWWNVSAENQATDRAYRIGQTRNVEVIKLVCEDSIEQRVIELQNLKKDIIDKIIAKDESAITGFALEDLDFILG